MHWSTLALTIKGFYKDNNYTVARQLLPWYFQKTHNNSLLPTQVIKTEWNKRRSKSREGRAMAQAVSRRLLTSEARVPFRSVHVVLVVVLGRILPRSTSTFPCQFHSTGAPLHGKTEKWIIFTTGLHDKPQGCCGFVSSAAGPFTAKNYGERKNDTYTGKCWHCQCWLRTSCATSCVFIKHITTDRLSRRI
jgi:hypothetical protein